MVIADVGSGLGVGALLLLALYILPGIIATSRHTKNAGPTWIINLFLGWTFVGWVVALAMAYGEKAPRTEMARTPGWRGLFDFTLTPEHQLAHMSHPHCPSPPPATLGH